MCGSGCGAGSAYVFQPNGPWPATMLPTTTLYPNVGLPVGSEMGFSVAISGSQGDGGGVHTAIVGAPQIASGPGLAYIYQEPSTGWPSTMTPTAELDNPYSSQDQFGYSVSITRSFLVIVGAPLATCEHSTQPRCPVGYPAQTGLAYGFRRPITRNWVNTAAPNVTMYPSDGQSGDLFGTAVGLGPWGVVGAPLHSNGINQGKGYFFGPYWGQAWPFADRELKVNGSVNPTGLNSDFGWSVGTAYEGRSAIVFGAPESNGYSGAAYLYIQ